MKLKTLIGVSTTNHPGLIKLETSLRQFGYDYQILVDPGMNWNWGGWPLFYNWCKEQINKPDGYTHFVATDGFDTLALGPQSEVEQAYKRVCPELDSFVYSVEKACFPITEWDQEYFKRQTHLNQSHRWRFLNGGQYMSPVGKFIEMWDQAEKHLNSQHWGHKKFLFDNEDGKVKLDYGCEIFQSVAFTTWQYADKISGEDHNSLGEFSQEGQRIVNNYLKTKAPLLHGNGRSDFQFVYNCLGL